MAAPGRPVAEPADWSWQRRMYVRELLAYLERAWIRRGLTPAEREKRLEETKRRLYEP